ALYGGLVAPRNNRWPNVQNDLMGIFGKVGGKLMPPGFSYKTFMYSQSMWMSYEKYIRKAAVEGLLGGAYVGDLVGFAGADRQDRVWLL
ncbi:hypothetical protein ACV35O_35005, partial [Pseudomonas aeruginosa]